ncbi:Uncharacterised protein [Mycobacteroides abscessus subsp. abscessus]|nr:Uncharacterised protein [Mycobacteroides abscessus subsp. abscessus]SKS53988.1 Uncharacterised protein [Mycobacteroides abscessus subsp. abscessus]
MAAMAKVKKMMMLPVRWRKANPAVRETAAAGRRVRRAPTGRDRSCRFTPPGGDSLLPRD